ncbi:MAG: F0F1 ATP synthase subunit A [Opitutaceae bacterium]|nr:F0F1 ATP synthase subunit A [Verrucomicrobiales bacterium]
MRLLNHILALVLFLSCALAIHAAEPAAAGALPPVVEAAGEAHGGGGEPHGLKPYAPVFHVGPLQFTNSMLITWIVAIGLIVFAQLATRNMQMVPSGLQNFAEWLVESMYGFFEGILGKDLVKKSFWFFCTLFLFILATNWFGLVPGVGTVGHGSVDAAGHFHLEKPFFRGGNADLNMTLAMSLVFFFLWTMWAFQSLGFVGFFKHIFAGVGGGKGFMAVFMTAIFIFVGLIEVISIAFRPVSLSFRLYGNVFAGENILESMMILVPWLGWILPLPFYFLELLVGLVQALVFALLTSVFTALMCAHHEKAHGDAHGHEHGGGHAH